MASLSSSTNTTAKAKARRYSEEQWNAQKEGIERLYLTEDRPLKDVMRILDQVFGFRASEKQLKTKLTKWGFDIKNLKAETMEQLARTKAKRKLENKKTGFRVKKKAVDDRKIDRFLSRGDITDEQLLSMTSPVNALSPCVSVFTPQSVCSPTPEFQLETRSLRLSTPGFNFQALSIIDSINDTTKPGSSAPLQSIPENMTVDYQPYEETCSAVLQTDLKSRMPVFGDKTDKSRYQDPLAIVPGDTVVNDSSLLPIAQMRPLMLDQLKEYLPLATWLEGEIARRSINHARRSSPSTAPPTAAEKITAHVVKPFDSPRSQRTLRKRPSPSASPEYYFTWIWTCCSCNNQGCMNTETTMHCPDVECSHLRCGLCDVELVHYSC